MGEWGTKEEEADEKMLPRLFSEHDFLSLSLSLCSSTFFFCPRDEKALLADMSVPEHSFRVNVLCVCVCVAF